MVGTRQAVAGLMAWSGIEEQGEAITLMIHGLHEMRPHARSKQELLSNLKLPTFQNDSAGWKISVLHPDAVKKCCNRRSISMAQAPHFGTYLAIALFVQR